MTGFGLYEVLRIFLPGAVAAAVLGLVLRLATGSGPLFADGPAKALIASLTGVAFVFAALVIGFLLYLADIPIKARIHREGDPRNDIAGPWVALDQILSNLTGEPATWATKRNRSIYFLLTDAHLPTELHKKVYYFGGMYKMYFDARLVMVAALAFGPALGLQIVSNRTIEWRPAWSYMWPIILCVTVAALAGAVGEFGHAKKSIKSTGPGYVNRLRNNLCHALPIAVLIFMTQACGWILADRQESLPAVSGFLLCAISMVLWTMFELGPPAEYPPGRKFWERGLRDSVLLILRCEGSQNTQHIPAQRTLIDLALMTPGLFGAATLTIQQGRSPSAVLLWSGFVMIPILIMTIRKHELHLLYSYNDQSTWFEFNKTKILSWVMSGPTTDKWA